MYYYIIKIIINFKSLIGVSHTPHTPKVGTFGVVSVSYRNYSIDKLGDYDMITFTILTTGFLCGIVCGYVGLATYIFIQGGR